MNIFLIHGDDSEKSYLRLYKFAEEAKKRSWEVVYLDESPIPIKENISSGSLFVNTRFFIHRNIKKLSKNDLIFLKKYVTDYDGNLILFSDTAVSSQVVKSLPKDTKIEEFKLPVIIWKFLDTIYPGNTKTVLTTMHKILEKEPAEKLLGLLSWHLRDLYWAKKDPNSFATQSWRLSKLKAQAVKFEARKLENLINDFALIDVKSKTSNYELGEMLDITFAERLE